MLEEYREAIWHCMKCGACRLAWGLYTPMCPSGVKYGFDSHYAIGRVALAKALLEKQIQMDSDLMRRVYTCTSCGACDEQCHDAVGVDPLRIIEALKCAAVEDGRVPPEVRNYLKAMSLHGNPYLLPAERRGDWAGEGPGEGSIEKYDGQEFLFYVGDTGSYDDRGRRIAGAVAEALSRAGISYGCLLDRELSDGNEVSRLGDKWLYESIARSNIELFKRLGVRKIVTLSPHAFHAFKNDYPGWCAEFEVLHYTELLLRSLQEGSLKITADCAKRVCYHDPCFLGRHNRIYDAPRELLESIPRLKLVEMERNRNNAFCCGGGGGNFFTDLLGGGDLSPGRLRVQEALETGADILATSCPKCLVMLDDAIKAEGAENRIAVRDISQLLRPLSQAA